MKVTRCDGRLGSRIERYGVEFCFRGRVDCGSPFDPADLAHVPSEDFGLVWVTCDRFSFAIGPDDELKWARGWPRARPWETVEEWEPANEDERQLKEMALQICQEALAVYKAHEFEADLHVHRQELLQSAVNVVRWRKDWQTSVGMV